MTPFRLRLQDVGRELEHSSGWAAVENCVRSELRGPREASGAAGSSQNGQILGARMPSGTCVGRALEVASVYGPESMAVNAMRVLHRATTATTYLLLDALDEVPQKHLRSLLKWFEGRPGVLITSRPPIRLAARARFGARTGGARGRTVLLAFVRGGR